MKLLRPISTRSLLALFVIAALALLPPRAMAEPFRTFDNGGGDANFGTAANWDSNAVPGANEGAVINVNSPNVALLITSNQTADTLRISDGRTVTQSDGTLTIANIAGGSVYEERGLWIGEFGWNNVFNMQGGSIVINDDYDGIILGKTSGAQGIMNFSGGTITNTASDTFIGADREGIWNQTGGTFTAGTVYLARWNYASGEPPVVDPNNIEKGFVYLDGGTFAATRVQKGDGNEAFFNFNGGTLQARASVTDFFHSMTRANVRNGGAVIDTAGFDVTVAQALLHSDIGGDNATDGGLTKNGTGTLTLTGWSTYTGDTNINAGTLAIGGGASLYNGGAIAGNIKVNNGGTLRFDRTDTFGLATTLSPVVLTVNAGGNVLSNNQLNSIHHVVLNGGTLTANGGLGPDYGAYGLNGTVTANGAATSIIANGGGSVNFVRIGREGTSESTTFDVTNAGGALVVDVPLKDNFSASSGLIKAGPGTMVVGAANSYTGITAIDAGTVRVDVAPTAGNTYYVGNGTTTGTAASLLLGGGTSGLTGGVTFDRAVSINPGDGTNRTIGGSNTSGTNTFSGSISFFGSDNSGENRSVTLTAAAGGTVSITGTLTGYGWGVGQNVIKTGAGTVEVANNNNSYWGTTTVKEGTLNVTGLLPGGSAVTVGGDGSGGAPILAGNGTIGGATTIAAAGTGVAGTHAPGNSAVNGGVGTQAFSSTLNYGNGSIFEWDLGASKDGDGLDGDTGTAGADFDGVSVTGNITVGSGTVFRVILGDTAWTDMQNLSNAFWNTPYITQVWNMSAIYGKSFTSGGFASVQTNHDVSSYGSFTIDGTSLTWTAVPEAGNALAGLLLAAGLLRRRRAHGA